RGRTRRRARHARRAPRDELGLSRDLRARAARAAVHGRGRGAGVRSRLWTGRDEGGASASHARWRSAVTLVAWGGRWGLPSKTREPESIQGALFGGGRS